MMPGNAIGERLELKSVIDDVSSCGGMIYFESIVENSILKFFRVFTYVMSKSGNVGPTLSAKWLGKFGC